ncbi:hypothetical protein ACFYZ5_37590 [Streptomyces chartreusis]
MCDRGGAIGGQGDRTDPVVALVTLWQFFTSADAPPSGGGSVTK